MKIHNEHTRRYWKVGVPSLLILFGVAGLAVTFWVWTNPNIPNQFSEVTSRFAVVQAILGDIVIFSVAIIAYIKKQLIYPTFVLISFILLPFLISANGELPSYIVLGFFWPIILVAYVILFRKEVRNREKDVQ